MASYENRRVTRTNGIASKKGARRVDSLDAGAGFVGPFELDSVVAERAGFPCTDVTDLAMDVVVPTLAGNGIGDGLAQFVGGRRGKRIEHSPAASTTGAARIGHYGVVDGAG